jgi:hypothetical protein
MKKKKKKQIGSSKRNIAIFLKHVPKQEKRTSITYKIMSNNTNLREKSSKQEGEILTSFQNSL